MKSSKVKRPNPIVLDVVWLSVVAAVMATLTAGYGYQTGGHLEQPSVLPVLMRALDSPYLADDGLTDASMRVGPLSDFARFMAALPGVMPLPLLYILLTVLANILVAVITGLFARDLFQKSDLAGVLASCFVMSMDTFALGWGSSTHTAAFVANHLSTPFVLLSIWTAIRQRPLICATSAGVASLLDPLLGLETGALALMVMALQVILGHGNRVSTSRRLALARIGGAALVLGGVAALSLVPYFGMERTSALMHLRYPQRYVPSSLGQAGYLEPIMFLIATAIAWHWWREDSQTHREVTVGLLALALGGLLLGLGKHFLLESVPSRILATAQAFRLPFLVQWLGLVLVAGTTAGLLQIHNGREGRFDAYLLLVGVLSPLTMGATHLERFVRKRSSRLKRLVDERSGFELAFMSVVIALLLLAKPRITTVFLFWILFVPLCLAYLADRRLSRGFVVVSTLSLVAALSVSDGILTFDIGTGRDHIWPACTLSDPSGDEVNGARYAGSSTAQGAIFVTPRNAVNSG